LHISGSDRTGLLKAAQALTLGTIQSGENPQTAVISGVKPDDIGLLVPDERTFADLGYPTRNSNSIGLSTLEYRFYLPPGYVPGTNPHLNLMYNHSTLLDFGNSGVMISLNDQRISSIRFTEETATQMNSLEIPLYADFLRTGDNRLVLQVELRPTNICSNFSNHGVWFTVNANSLVNLPLLPARLSDANLSNNLNQYPYPFISSPTLGNVGFVLANNDSDSWKIAAKLAAQLGQRATGQLLTPQVAFADAVADDFLNNHLILVGLPANLPLISEMESVMPAPFAPGSNMVTERSLSVTYRLPEGASLGYIELFTSPWDSERTVLTLLGSTTEGLGWALNSLTDSTLRGQVAGNYVVVNRTQVLATDTRIRTGTNMAAMLVPEAEPIQITPQVLEAGQLEPATPSWILPAIVFISLLIAIIVVFVIVRSLRKSRI
jgi:cellulose synthase operon protein B